MRVSKADGSQVTDLQLDALLTRGEPRAHLSRITAPGQDGRPALAASQALRAGDTLVVWKLDRLGHLQHLVTTIDGLHKTGAGFRVLSGQGPALTPPRPQAS